MKQWFLLALLILASVAGKAEKQPLNLELDPEIFYKEPSPESSWMQDKNYQSTEKQLSSRCQEMREEMKTLKGKPQRRFALQQRYEAECLAR